MVGCLMVTTGKRTMNWIFVRVLFCHRQWEKCMNLFKSHKTVNDMNNEGCELLFVDHWLYYSVYYEL